MTLLVWLANIFQGMGKGETTAKPPITVPSFDPVEPVPGDDSAITPPTRPTIIITQTTEPDQPTDPARDTTPSAIAPLMEEPTPPPELFPNTPFRLVE